ncbi:MerR family transcriptional regulator [Burkholderiaceae bacterium 26]|nr:MerR family transcriptional regulator [Burkholderiaceae bacterium 26]
MKIGELARLSGVAASRIRFYEASGLLQPAERHSNGYREYAPESVTRLEIILRAQSAGFSLEEIRALLPGHLGEWPREELLLALRRKVAEIDVLEQHLAQNKRDLLALIREVDHEADGEDCADRARRVFDKMNLRPLKQPAAEPPARPARKRG